MAIIVNTGAMLARQRFDYSWEIPPTQKSYRRAFAWPRCGGKVDTVDAVVEEEEGRRQEFVSDRDERIYGIGYRDFPRVIQGIGCFLSPRQLESRIRFSPIFASSGVCIIECVYRE